MKDQVEGSLFTVDLDVIQQTFSKWSDLVKHAFQYFYRLNPVFTKISLFIYGFSFLILFPTICHDLPYSIYWITWDNKDIVKHVTERNHEHFVTASNYVRGLKPRNIMSNPSLTIGVITVKRTMGTRPLGYLTQVMAKLDHLTSSGHPFSSIRILICDVHAGPGPHTEADLLQQAFERKLRFPESDPSAVIMDR